MSATQQRFARGRQSAIGSIEPVKGTAPEQHREQAIHVLRRPSVNDVDIEGDYGDAREHRCHAADDVMPRRPGAAAVKLKDDQQTCVIPPFGDACCSILGSLYDVRIRGTFDNGGYRRADLMFVRLDRLEAVGTGQSACGPAP